MRNVQHTNNDYTSDNRIFFHRQNFMQSSGIPEEALLPNWQRCI